MRNYLVYWPLPFRAMADMMLGYQLFFEKSYLYRCLKHSWDHAAYRRYHIYRDEYEGARGHPRRRQYTSHIVYEAKIVYELTSGGNHERNAVG